MVAVLVTLPGITICVPILRPRSYCRGKKVGIERGRRTEKSGNAYGAKRSTPTPAMKRIAGGQGAEKFP
jgi:hypothetical protein